MLVRCEKHGRVYDNASERSCPLCRQGAPATVGKPERKKLERATVVNLVILGVLLIGGGAGWYFFFRTPPPPPAPAPVVIDTMALLDDGERYVDSTSTLPLRQARAYLAALERIYADRGPLLNFSAGLVDTTVTARAARTRARQYVQFRSRWLARVTAAKPDSQAFYRPGARYAEQLLSADNVLGAARSALRQAAPPGEVLPPAERQRLFQSARGYLNSARTTLSELP